MEFTKITEQASVHNDLEKKSISELLHIINEEDHSVPMAIKKALPQIENAIKQVVFQLKKGGRLFYIGAGTSGRLGILDASECPPTYGVSPDLVIGIIAGGDYAIRHAVENAEDNLNQGWLDLQSHQINNNDIVVGIAASGTTPYVINALKMCNTHDIPTVSISCNPNSPLSQSSKFPIEVIVGPEVITGSSRMKAGTAQKLVLNMISTTTMIQLGKVKGNKMVDMKMTNAKLIQRGIQMLVEELQVSEQEAKSLLEKHQNVRKAIIQYKK
ncbi:MULTISPECIES: N-acetylmuramic acid 6-phosphate etherase [Myroides]|uniref:N-acetylmuramic acid 6-phosphate etherase n=1 Tax=Myroides albus TaxID=2562892 RepID=A0A6I3LRK1_9FLAO|nr:MULTISPECIES: N-acetylmuramic acid 6-phosphate etherase [Myroides]MTG98605.1 N-acetylmuramic acid 6-phosphate etherase [Myroides albus]MVX35875.1 N-acetylmuramic acid 6-phosphate etherase [Myroides sp. LoEW2-1]UVD79975.1 N-acetylmuramic acid 6-phosphate etherase [Myroides albus]